MTRHEFKHSLSDAERQQDIMAALNARVTPDSVKRRLDGVNTGRSPWISTLTPSELMIVRSHGIKPISIVSATCWMHYDWSWTLGHSQGWKSALDRLRTEAVTAGANAVLDVKMRTVRLDIENSMDFTLVGTAVKIDGLQPSRTPIVVTLPALEFIKLLDADVVPTGIAVGAHYDWLYGCTSPFAWSQGELSPLTQFWSYVRDQAFADLLAMAAPQGNGVLAHVNFNEMFEVGDSRSDKRYLVRHIVVATTVDSKMETPFPHDVKMVVDMSENSSLTGRNTHHQSYTTNDEEGSI